MRARRSPLRSMAVTARHAAESPRLPGAHVRKMISAVAMTCKRHIAVDLPPVARAGESTRHSRDDARVDVIDV